MQRLDAVRTRILVLEQTRLGMLMGVAIGWELGARLVIETAAAAAEPPGLKDQAVEG